MKRFFMRVAFVMLLIGAVSFSANGKELIPVGQIVGLELRNGSVTVASFDEDLGNGCQEAGMKIGDEIRMIDGIQIRSAEDIRQALVRSDGSVKVTVSRNGKLQEIPLQPKITKDGPKLGVYLRQGVTGIGTVTWYDSETGSFGTLGHGVNDTKGKLLNMTEGKAYDARVLAVRKGRSGEPGQLMGAVERLDAIGELKKNTPQGVFGNSDDGWKGKVCPVAQTSQIRTGEAKILSTVSGRDTREYSVEILKIYPTSKQTGRNMLIRVTDPELLEATGGIVQGMSGSPIIQDGKLVGAVTYEPTNNRIRNFCSYIGIKSKSKGVTPLFFCISCDIFGLLICSL